MASGRSEGLRFFGNAGYYLAAQAVPLAVGVAVTPYLLAELGNQRFTLLTLTWLIANYLNVFDFGVARGTTHFVARARAFHAQDEIRRTWWTAVALQSLIGVTLAAFLILAVLIGRSVETTPSGPLSSVESAILLCFAALSLPASVVGLALRGNLEAFERFGTVSVIRGFSNAALLGIPAVVVSLGGDLGVVGLCLACAQVCVMACYAVFSLAQLHPDFRGPGFDVDRARSLVGYGWPITVIGIAVPLVQYADRFMISALRPLTELPYYTVPSDALLRLQMVPASVSATTFPSLSASTRELDSGWGRLYARSARSVFVLTLTIALILVAAAHPLVALWLGQDFAGRAVKVAQLLAISFFLESIAWAPNTLLFATGRSRTVGLLFLATFAASLPLTLLGVILDGIRGAAWANLGRSMLEAALFGAAAQRLLPPSVSFTGFGRRRTVLFIVAGVATAFVLVVLTS